MQNKRHKILQPIFSVLLILWINCSCFISVTNADISSNLKTSASLSVETADAESSIAKTISHVLVLDTYAQMLIDLPSIHLENAGSIQNEPLTQKILQGYRTIHQYATSWLYGLQPQMVTVTQDVLQSNTFFQQSYTNLIAYVNNNDKINFSKEVNKLYQNSLTSKENVDSVLKQLKQYRNTLSDLSQNLKRDTVPFIAMATSTNTSIPILKQQIETQQNIIKNCQDQIKTGELLQKILLGCIGEPMITNAEDNIKIAEQTIHDLKIKMYGAQWEVAQIIDATSKVIFMTETIDTAIDAVQHLSSYWCTISAKYHVLLNNIQNINDINNTFIREDLLVARESSENIQKFTNQLQDIHSIHYK